MSVEILKNEKCGNNAFNREVNLTCLGKVVCNAKSKIVLNNEEYLKLIEEKKVGIGQLFRFLHLLPEFELISIGKESNRFWRVYNLIADGIVATIHEEFPLNIFELKL